MILIVCAALPVGLANAALQSLLPLVVIMIPIKAWLAVDRFMELRHAPRHWRCAVLAGSCFSKRKVIRFQRE